MCRIMSISNVSRIKDLDAAMLKIRDLVCEQNRDGFGYSVSYKNDLFSEKFIKPDDFIGLNKTLMHDKMSLAIFDNSDSLTHGNHGEKPLAIIAHGRTSTNFRGDVDYSHPFVKEDNAFIHNGVVDVPKKHGFDLVTDNDSEYLANVYWKHGHSGLSSISGYFAFMNLKLNGKIEIAKDNVASLHAAYIPELDSYVFATMENMIIRFCTALGYTSTKVSPVQAMRYFTVQGSSIKNVTPIEKSLREKRLSVTESKAFKDYSKPNKSKPKSMFPKSQGTKVLANDQRDEDASYLSKFNDPHYYMVDDEASDFEKKYGVR
jgi:hypothetical protein